MYTKSPILNFIQINILFTILEKYLNIVLHFCTIFLCTNHFWIQKVDNIIQHNEIYNFVLHVIMTCHSRF